MQWRNFEAWRGSAMREMSTEAEWGTASHLAGAEDAGESVAAVIREAKNVEQIAAEVSSLGSSGA